MNRKIKRIIMYYYYYIAHTAHRQIPTIYTVCIEKSLNTSSLCVQKVSEDQ